MLHFSHPVKQQALLTEKRKKIHPAPVIPFPPSSSVDVDVAMCRGKNVALCCTACASHWQSLKTL